MTEELAALLKRGGNIVFFGGAGVSTESGIPDFRSAQGLYSAQRVFGHSPEELLSHDFFMRHPKTFYQYYKQNLIHADAQPNAAHRALAWLEEMGKLKAVVTQNIDGLHQMAGSKTVYELHGSVQKNYCMDCGAAYGLEDVTGSPETVPLCRACGGVIRPDVVLYGETLDDAVVAGAQAAIARADMLIVGGTSLAVYPAAGLIRFFGGDNLVLINKSPTPYDADAGLVIREPIGEALGGAVDSTR
jgi:NAD-dependent deacetylase